MPLKRARKTTITGQPHRATLPATRARRSPSFSWGRPRRPRGPTGSGSRSRRSSPARCTGTRQLTRMITESYLGMFSPNIFLNYVAEKLKVQKLEVFAKFDSEKPLVETGNIPLLQVNRKAVPQHGGYPQQAQRGDIVHQQCDHISDLYPNILKKDDCIDHTGIHLSRNSRANHYHCIRLFNLFTCC